MATQSKVAQALKLLKSCFPKKEISDLTVQVYTMALSDLTDEQLDIAVAKAAATEKFFPMPAVLREYVHGTPTSPADNAELAWEAFRSVSTADHSVSFEDRLIHSVVNAMGGFAYALELPIDEYNTHYKREWLKMYRRIAMHPPLHIPDELTGRYALENAGWSDDPRFSEMVKEQSRVREIDCDYIRKQQLALPGQGRSDGRSADQIGNGRCQNG